jgi:hypothetical protein
MNPPLELASAKSSAVDADVKQCGVDRRIGERAIDLRATLAGPPNSLELQNNRQFVVLDEKGSEQTLQMRLTCNFFAGAPKFILSTYIPSFFIQTKHYLHPRERLARRKFQLQLLPNRHGSRRNLAKIC